jgi:deoxycytidylate deaminase
MSEASAVSTGVLQVFSHRESFIVVALTGRTGSGCSTAAKILQSPNFDGISFPTIPVPPRSHEDRKDRIVQNWARDHWHAFQAIQVSQMILLLALSNPLEAFLHLVSKEAQRVDIDKLRSVLEGDYSKHQSTKATIGSIRHASDEQVQSACDHLTSRLPIISQNIKNLLDVREDRAYTRVFQRLGDNVRRSGNPLSESIDSGGLLVLPGTIASVIKLFRLRNKIRKATKNYFVIDALRHPFEVRYLRERISPFYTVAVSTSETSRKARLLDAGLRKDEVDELDDKEYPAEAKERLKQDKKGKKAQKDDYSTFVSQDIQACLAISDIYLTNEGNPEDVNIEELGRLICRYVVLMQHPGLVTPTSVERCMQIAFSAKLNSGCISRQVGAAITDKDFSIKAVGWNDPPRGQVPCLLRNAAHSLSKGFDTGAYSNFEQNESLFLKYLRKTKVGGKSSEHFGGRNLAYCFKTIYNGIKGDRNQVHTRSLHAEENAFLQIARYGGQGLAGGCLFTTASPCELCAKKAYQLGVTEIYYIDPYPGISKEHILSGGEGPPKLNLFTGAVGRAYHELYLPIMPYKDELELLIPD